MRDSSAGLLVRLGIGVVMAIFALFSYLGSQQYNPVTGENQRVSMSPEQEIALGRQSVPQLLREFGGEYRDREVQDAIDRIGERLVRSSPAGSTSYQFEFYVLDDPNTINAFALPGGPVFITTALLSRLESEDEVAGVLGHEIGHVVARHGAQRLAQNELTNGIIGAVAVASGDATATQTAAVIGQLINVQYGREDELESDFLGVCFMIDAGYDPNELTDVMRVLAEASGGNRQAEFFSTHPNPDNRIEEIESAIANANRDCP